MEIVDFAADLLVVDLVRMNNLEVVEELRTEKPSLDLMVDSFVMEVAQTFSFFSSFCCCFLFEFFFFFCSQHSITFFFMKLVKTF